MKYQLLVPNIGVSDVKETVDFYTQILEFTLIQSFSVEEKLVWAMVSSGNVNFMFQEQINLIEEYDELKDCSLRPAMTYYIKVTNADSLYRKIQNSGCLLKEKHTTHYGKKEFALKDNNGHILVISEDNDYIIKYDNFFLPVDDYNKAKKFYSEVLGFKMKFEFKEQGMAAFAVGNEESAIILKDKSKFPEAKPTIWIEVDNVQKMYEILRSKDVIFLSEPFRIRTGWAVEFIDTSGNRLGITDYTIDFKSK